ncbi:MAG: hypothetical protein AAB953_03830 [Patescibacteria group bacterium]
MNQRNLAEQFDGIRACTDPKYLDENLDAAAKFANGNLQIDNINFIQALHIKGALGEAIDLDLLTEALNRGETVQREVIFYLARVQIPQMDQRIISLLNEALEGNELDTGKIYWLIYALIETETQEAKFYLKGLIKHERLQDNPILELALDEAGWQVQK